MAGCGCCQSDCPDCPDPSQESVTVILDGIALCGDFLDINGSWVCVNEAAGQWATVIFDGVHNPVELDVFCPDNVGGLHIQAVSLLDGGYYDGEIGSPHFCDQIPNNIDSCDLGGPAAGGTAQLVM